MSSEMLQTDPHFDSYTNYTEIMQIAQNLQFSEETFLNDTAITDVFHSCFFFISLLKFSYENIV